MANEFQLTNFYSLLFLLTAYTYFFFGFYVLIQNSHVLLNRVFSAVCVSLGLWAYAYCIANSALTIELAFLWHRISVLGWGLMYSLLLHYFLVLTERTDFLKRKITYGILYGPALINIFIFGVYTPFAQAEYDLIKMTAGWVNVSENGLFDWYFYIYYLTFSILSLVALWTWHRNNLSSHTKRIKLLVTISFAITMIMGTVTDVIFRLFMQDTKPQLGVIFAIVPITTIFLVVKKYGFMVKVIREDEVLPNEILTAKMRLLFYRLLTNVLIGASLLTLFEIFVYDGAITAIFYTSGMFFSISVMVFVLTSLPLSVKTQDLILSMIMGVMVPLTVLRYMNHNAHNIIWVAPFLLMILASIFNQRIMLSLITLSAALTQLYIWLQYSVQTVTITRSDHISRIIIILVAAVMVYVISLMYQRRLKEIEDQTKMQRFMSEISTHLVSVNTENLDDKMDWVLKQSGQFFGMDRAYLFQSSEELLAASYTHEWCAQDVVPFVEHLGTLPYEAYPWWVEQMNARKLLYISDVSFMPDEAQSERSFLQKQQVKSLIAMPLVIKEKVIGFLGLDSVNSFKKWEEPQKEALQIMANVVSDALMKVSAEKEINYMAYYDMLTGLSNRTLFSLQMEKAISLAGRSEKLIGILFLDLDAFKAVNDTMGHEAGDLLLKEIGKRLIGQVRRHDTVCRFGGDEFLVMFPQLDTKEQIKQACEKVISIFKEPITLKEQEFYITASGGIAVYPIDGEEAEALIKNADLAMYTSKDHGKNQVTFCSTDMKETVKEKMQLTNDLYRALERDELLLYYQPQIQIETGKIVGLEALIRWQHPQRGMVSPAQFIPLAEQTGLIHSIGEWVLKTACYQNKAWQDMGLAHIVMAVNLSVEQFRTPHLTKVVASALNETGLAPTYLELEITEGIAIKESDYIIPILNELKSLGVAISIDDFGTEYSSLSRLKELPIDRIKMAMEFVQGIDKGTKDEAIAMVIINLAKNLGLKVIAEGVETEGQLAFLTKGVCDEVQGYYFHRPMPAAEIETILFGMTDDVNGALINEIIVTRHCNN